MKPATPCVRMDSGFTDQILLKPLPNHHRTNEPSNVLLSWGRGLVPELASFKKCDFLMYVSITVLPYVCIN